MRVAIAVLLLSSLGLAGCADDDSSPDRDALEASRARWEALGVNSYEYRFQRGCFCPPEDTREVWVTVTNDRISGVRYVDTNEAVPAARFDRYATVDGLFDLAQDALDRSADSYQATFDPDLAYPRRIAIDYVREAADEEVTIVTRELH